MVPRFPELMYTMDDSDDEETVVLLDVRKSADDDDESDSDLLVCAAIAPVEGGRSVPAQASTHACSRRVRPQCEKGAWQP